MAYTSDTKGQNTVQPIGHRPYVEVHLWLPSSVDESEKESSQAAEEPAQRLSQPSAEVRDASPASLDALLRAQKLAADMMERNLVLAGKLQDAIARIAEIERAVGQRLASLPLAPDYTLVLQSVVAAIRDIGTSAMPRNDGRQLDPGAHSAPSRAPCADKASAAGADTLPASSDGGEPGDRACENGSARAGND